MGVAPILLCEEPPVANGERSSGTGKQFLCAAIAIGSHAAVLGVGCICALQRLIDTHNQVHILVWRKAPEGQPHTDAVFGAVGAPKLLDALLANEEKRSGCRSVAGTGRSTGRRPGKRKDLAHLGQGRAVVVSERVEVKAVRTGAVVLCAKAMYERRACRTLGGTKRRREAGKPGKQSHSPYRCLEVASRSAFFDCLEHLDDACQVARRTEENLLVVGDLAQVAAQEQWPRHRVPQLRQRSPLGGKACFPAILASASVARTLHPSSPWPRPP